MDRARPTVAIVANPTAGRGTTAKLIPRVRSLLSSIGVEHRFHESTGASDARSLARGAADDGIDVVVALGGDGQVHACANGVVGTAAALAVIPGGSGNDFARSLGLDRGDPMAAAALLADPPIRSIDAVRLHTPEQECWFVNVAGAGFDSEVNAYANGVRFLRGTAKYVYAVFVTLARFEPGGFTVTVDGVDHAISAMMIAVGNAASYGGGMRICPDAVVDDGQLEVCVIGAIPRWEFVKTFPKVFSGRHVTHPDVTMLRGADVRISAAEREFQVFGDGERIGTLPARFTVEPGGLRVVAPTAHPGWERR